jgi:hypothetical protein
MPVFEPPKWTVKDSRKCAKAAAIMAIRFRPTTSKFLSAHQIYENLRNLPCGTLKTFCATEDGLKLALSNLLVRDALLRIYPERFEFIRSSTTHDVIKHGSTAFRKGKQIKVKWIDEVVEEDMVKLRTDIAILFTEILGILLAPNEDEIPATTKKRKLACITPDYFTTPRRVLRTKKLSN